MNVIVGNIIIAIGIAIMFIGMFGFYKFNDFYSKLLVAATIDTMALITVLIGAIIRSGVTWFSFKVVLILVIVLVLNPVSTSKIALSARNNEIVKEEERLEAKRLELEAERLKSVKAEEERSEAEKLEITAERLRLEAEKLELEAKRLKSMKAEEERLEAERED